MSNIKVRELDPATHLLQGSTTDLKRVYVSAYMLKNLGVHHVQGKNYKKLKKQGL